MSLASGDLTTLPTAKAYVEPLPSDAVLGGLITRVSRMIQGCINRSLLVPKVYVEQFNGTGTQALVLPNYPLISLTSLVIDGVSTPISPQLGPSPPPTPQFGYRFQPWNGVPPGNPAILELVGFNYGWGSQDVVVTYKAGYEIVGETATVVAGTPPKVTPATPYGIWATDEGVTYSDGAALVAVAANPSVGEYVVPDPEASTPILYYTFSSADVGQGIILNYGYVPGDVEQVALEMIAERASYRKRAGVRSQSLAGQEMITYDSGMNGWAVKALMPYVSVISPNLGGNT